MVKIDAQREIQYSLCLPFFAMVPAERGLDHWPNIYCGVLAFVLVPVYFLHRKIPLKR